MYNSTIKQKRGICQICKDGREKPLTNKLCGYHYQLNLKLKSVNKVNRKEVEDDDESVSILKKDLDVIFSQWLRLSNADDSGFCSCFICGESLPYSEMQAGHFIKRGNSLLRFDERNVKVNCRTCNELKDGNLVEYAAKLEEERAGITEILFEEANLVYKFTRYELKQMIADYSDRLLKLKR